MKHLTKSEIEAKFEQINKLNPDELTAEEAASLSMAESIDDGSVILLEDLQAELEGYSGSIRLRMPKSLHRQLKLEAEVEGVSLNTYMLYKLSKN